MTLSWFHWNKAYPVGIRQLFGRWKTRNCSKRFLAGHRNHGRKVMKYGVQTHNVCKPHRHNLHDNVCRHRKKTWSWMQRTRKNFKEKVLSRWDKELSTSTLHSWTFHDCSSLAPAFSFVSFHVLFDSRGLIWFKFRLERHEVDGWYEILSFALTNGSIPPVQFVSTTISNIQPIRKDQGDDHMVVDWRRNVISELELFYYWRAESRITVYQCTKRWNPHTNTTKQWKKSHPNYFHNRTYIHHTWA